MWENSTTSLENFIKRYSNYTLPICKKSLEYESIAYLSYQKKAEQIRWTRRNAVDNLN